MLASSVLIPLPYLPATNRIPPTGIATAVVNAHTHFRASHFLHSLSFRHAYSTSDLTETRSEHRAYTSKNSSQATLPRCQRRLELFGVHASGLNSSVSPAADWASAPAFFSFADRSRRSFTRSRRTAPALLSPSPLDSPCRRRSRLSSSSSAATRFASAAALRRLRSISIAVGGSSRRPCSHAHHSVAIPWLESVRSPSAYSTYRRSGWPCPTYSAKNVCRPSRPISRRERSQLIAAPHRVRQLIPSCASVPMCWGGDVVDWIAKQCNLTITVFFCCAPTVR